ncbi:MAG: U32 family peptidase [Nanoarchaeota archaeon]|nr:U32 family peptidase [Nanoarchaeota archaeon]
MRITIATNWDDKLIEELAKINNTAKNRVFEVFGSIRCDFLGSCRPGIILPEISMEDIARHIKVCHKHNIKFNYIMNAISLHNREYDIELRKKVIDFVKNLVDVGIDAITITNPVLIEVIRKNFPELYICASTACKIDNLRRIKWYEDMGVNRIILETDINRDFKLLKKIADQTKLKLEVLTNLQCILHCPNNTYDYICDSFRSQELDKKFFYNYPKIKCSYEKLQNPVEFIKSPWIRPEDLHYYEEIGIGIAKIAGREASTDWLLNCAIAYANEKYDGNLFDLIGNMVISSIGRYPIDENNLPPIEIVIDNKSLNGFIWIFKEKGCNFDCKDCDYCERFAKNIKIDSLLLEEYKKRAKLLLEKMRCNQI